jgi:hypothetical protein
LICPVGHLAPNVDRDLPTYSDHPFLGLGLTMR